MNLRDSTRLTLRHLRQRGLRSWLTILGIVIGVAAVVSIVSMGEGLQASVTDRLQRLGGDIITITPGFSRATGFRGFEGDRSSTATLTDQDLAVVRSTPGIQTVGGTISTRGNVYYLGENAPLTLQGVDVGTWHLLTVDQIDSGRLLGPGDTNAVVLGNTAANQIFKQPITVNRQITIENQAYRVVGILQKTDFGRDDNAAFIPLDTARSIANARSPQSMAANQVSSITARVANRDDMDTVTSELENRLAVSRHVTGRTKDFTITTPASLQAVAQQITGTLVVFLTGIAAVSLLVGAVGISNTMYMSVLERTREIGLLKALGATHGEVLRLFVIESSLFGLVGGAIGATAGTVAALLLGVIGVRLFPVGGGSATVIPPQLILGALGFAMLIGALSGIFPARQAARLKPVEALRYE